MCNVYSQQGILSIIQHILPILSTSTVCNIYILRFTFLLLTQIVSEDIFSVDLF